MDQEPGNCQLQVTHYQVLLNYTQAYSELLGFIKLLNDAVVGKIIGDKLAASSVSIQCIQREIK